MNYFQLVLKQMRQRSLSTWLTLLSVMLGVGLAVAILVLGRESHQLFGQNSFGYDAIVGIKGSKLQLVLNTIYHMDQSPGNIPYDVYGRLLSPAPGVARSPDNYSNFVRIAVPTVVGDTLDGKYRIVGTSPKMFGFDEAGHALPLDQVLDVRPGEKPAVAQGRVFAPDKFEALVGSDIPKLTGKGIGSTFQATHGIPEAGQAPDIHKQTWTVVGVLAPTHTAMDRVLFIPLLSFYTIAEHGTGLKAASEARQGAALTAGADEDETGPSSVENGIEHWRNYDFDTQTGKIKIKIPVDEWMLSAIAVQSRGGNSEQNLEFVLQNNGGDTMACNPASVMREFFETFLSPTRSMLLIICSLVIVVAAVGILVSIYNAVSARLREIAILRALGATRTTVLTLICLEAGLVALAGAVLGLLLGHVVTGVGSWYMLQTFGQSLHWARVDLMEVAYLAGVVILALIAGLVPAMKAYRVPVATNLMAG